MRSLRARVAVAAVAATAVAFVLLGVAVVGTFAFDERRDRQHWELGRPHDPAPERFVGDGRGGPPPQARLLARRLTVGSLAVLALVGAAGLGLGSLALRPLGALRHAAEQVASSRDLGTRLPEGQGPEEVDSLANSLNAMLSRLQRSSAQTEQALEASRRFAADAGHELRTPLTSIQANLAVLARSPDLSGEQQRILADVVRQHARIVALLDALQALARGDAAAAVPREWLDLAEVVDAAVQHARTRHPRATVGFSGPDEVAMVGWPEGLRVLVDNLIENALRHGRPDGSVDVSLSVSDGRIRLTVDDDGPGIPPVDRQRVFERFARGSSVRAPGSGLGLALVAQQAAVHGGTAAIEDAPSGGARVTVDLAATAPAAARMRAEPGPP